MLQKAKLLHRNYCKKLHNGLFMQVKPADHVQAFIFWYGYYEKEAVLTWQTLLEPGMNVIDIGANTGYYTLVSAPKAAHVFAIEPATSARDMLRQNVELNKLANVTILSFAASDENGLADLYISGSDNMGMTGFKPAENFNGAVEYVNTMRMDDWWNQHSQPPISMMKIDVEGAEMKVLQGMIHLLKSEQPILFIEAIEQQLAQFDSSLQQLYIFLKDLGYQAFQIKGINELIPIAILKDSYSILFAPVLYKFPASISVKEQSG
jgi:FkbM family methyltransferase